MQTLFSEGVPIAVTPAELTTLRRLLALPPRQLKALIDVAEQQVALEDAPVVEPRDPVCTREGDAVVRPIACDARLRVFFGSDEHAVLPQCRWVRAGGGYECSTCSKLVEPGTDRYPTIAALFAGDGEPS
jgi:hypothetical protein